MDGVDKDPVLPEPPKAPVVVEKKDSKNEVVVKPNLVGKKAPRRNSAKPVEDKASHKRA